ncbi:MAG: RsmB/NOP family class I SAM-dependent RNA methyltransferase, partial [Lentisphaeria bacterium]|nr:RsmB/NOP family class I SAM-dependent RNA methyltransferase [Lentisphaeria bacterium]
QQVLARVVQALAERDAGSHDDLGTDEYGRLVRNALFAIERHRPGLEHVLQTLAPGRIRPRLRRVLWWAMAQMLWMRALPHAIVADTCVRFVRKRWSTHESGFVNALLRTFADGPPDRIWLEAMAEAPAWVQLELGQTLHKRWSTRFSEDELAALSQVLQKPAPLTVRLRADTPPPNVDWLCPLELPAWAPGIHMFECTDATALFSGDTLSGQNAYVQDPSTLLAPLMLDVQPGETVGDFCSAPGGKAILLAEKAGPEEGCILCLDRSPARLQRLAQNTEMLTSCRIIAADAAHPPCADQSIDALLLDVPCSNTGVIRRRPDVRRSISEERVRELVALQREILEGACAVVRHGGRLVYSTCSIEPEENGDQIQQFLKTHPEFRLVREQLLLPCDLHDGAYAALLERNGDYSSKSTCKSSA